MIKMCKGKYDLKPGKKSKKTTVGKLKEVNFVGKPATMKGKKKVPVGMYASKKDVMKY